MSVGGIPAFHMGSRRCTELGVSQCCEQLKEQKALGVGGKLQSVCFHCLTTGRSRLYTLPTDISNNHFRVVLLFIHDICSWPKHENE